MSAAHTFWGYRRADGAVGIRNRVVVLGVTDSVSGIVRHLAGLVAHTTAMPVWYGRGQFGEDNDIFRRTQIGLAKNPNVGAVLVVGIEGVSTRQVAEGIASSGKPVEMVSVQEVGIASNPALGWVADQVVDAGGVVYLSETSEWMGAEHILARRAKDVAVGATIEAAVRRIEDDARQRGVDIRGANPVPDNIRGGITTIEEKSLGAIIKAGTRTIQGVLPYATRAEGRGLYLMDTAAPAAESMTGLAAGGCQIIIFTTGQMNIMGCPVAPTMKITGNPRTAVRLADNVDVDVSAMLEGEPLATAGRRVLDAMLATASGRMTRAEAFGDEEIAISRTQPTV